MLPDLTNLPVWSPSRESNRLTLQLGARRAAPTRAEPGREVGSWTLHVFCAWRLSKGKVLLAGSGDLFTPADPDEDLETFDYEAPGATWWDARLAACLGGDVPLVIREATTDPLGGLRLALGDGSVLEVFPNSAPHPAFESEFWRLVPALGAGDELSMGTGGLERIPRS